MPLKRPVPLTVAIVHPEHGRIVINESDLAAWLEKDGWKVEGDESDVPADPKSVNTTVKKAAEVISGLDSAEAVAAYVEGDERKGVTEAAEKRAEELADDDPEE
jgi:hypothetical protein